MGYSLTRRPYLLVGFFHMIIGLLLFTCGVSWLFLTFFYWPQRKNGLNVAGQSAADFIANNLWTQMPAEHQAWAWIVYTAQVWTGFWVSTCLVGWPKCTPSWLVLVSMPGGQADLWLASKNHVTASTSSPGIYFLEKDACRAYWTLRWKTGLHIEAWTISSRAFTKSEHLCQTIENYS